MGWEGKVVGGRRPRCNLNKFKPSNPYFDCYLGSKLRRGECGSRVSHWGLSGMDQVGHGGGLRLDNGRERTIPEAMSLP